jgi:hypothetical protein
VIHAVETSFPILRICGNKSAAAVPVENPSRFARMTSIKKMIKTIIIFFLLKGW